MKRVAAWNLYPLIASLAIFATPQSQANTVEVDWTASGFYTSRITINAGDEVDIVNYDDTMDLLLTGAPPEGFYADIPPTDYAYVYYVPYVYNTPGTYSFSDQFANSVTVTVNALVPLSVAITAPANGAAFTAPATFTVTAVPAGGATPYGRVDFHVGTNLTGVAYSSPFTCTLTNLWMGNYNISAVVTDNDSATATNSIQVSVAPLMVTNYIAPVDCGTIYSSATVLRMFALTMGSSTEGGLEFGGFNASAYSAILLEISPQGTPVWGNTVQVHGIDGRNGMLLGSDYGSGTLLGSFPVAANTPDGQPLLFDVTSFVKSANGPYFGILFAAGPDLFGSTSDYSGQPPGLFAVGPAPMPQLTAARSSDQMIISWPTNYSAGLSLQGTASLGKGAAWNPVSPMPVQVGNQWMVTNSLSGTNRYFRLSSQYH